MTGDFLFVCILYSCILWLEFGIGWFEKVIRVVRLS